MNIAVVSGGSKGIGLAIATELDKLMLDEIWIISRTFDKNELFKTKIRHFPLDISKSDFSDKLKNELSCADFCIKYLVCSAGVGYFKDLCDTEINEISAMIDINCRALTGLITACLPYMKKGSRIINIASGAGFIPQPHFSVYASTKAFVISLSKSLKYELRHRKISVTCVCPGPVDTEFFSSLNPPEYKKKYVISAEMVAKGAIKASKKGKTIYSPTLSIKLVHLASKLIPSKLLLKFYK